jgi:hypothetical protein
MLTRRSKLAIIEIGAYTEGEKIVMSPGVTLLSARVVLGASSVAIAGVASTEIHLPYQAQGSPSWSN